MSEVPYDVPEGWTWTTIQTVVESVEKTNPSDKAEREFIYVDISSIDNVAAEIVDPKRYLGVEAPSRARQILRTDDIVFSTVRPYLRNVALVPPHLNGSVGSTGFCVLRCREILDSHYLFRYVLTDAFLGMLEPLQRGSSYPAVLDADVRQQPLPLPPLAEQVRIVAQVEALLARLDAARDRLTALRPVLARLRQSVLAAATSGRLTEDWRTAHPDVEPASALLDRLDAERRAALGKKYKAPTPPDTAALPDLPETWAWATFGHLMQSIKGGSTVSALQEESDFPILRSSSVRPFAVDFSDIRYLAQDKGRGEKSWIEEGDLLLTRLSGSIEFVACCAWVRYPPSSRVLFPDRIFQAKPCDARYAPWIEIGFAAPHMRNQVQNASRSAAGHQRVSITDLKDFVLPVPPIAEQSEIVRRVDELFARAERIESALEAALAAVARTRQAVLAKAFRGELVPTEADLARAEGRTYETAEALLARVRAEAAPSPKRRGRPAKSTPSLFP